MAYTLTQARPLLNAAELELFEQSRAEPVKQLTGAKLAGAVKRTRLLRDKYRDLYQRQTVAVRTSAPGAVTGDDNERTQRKADILQEVLERYEARASALQAQGSSKTGAKAGAKAGAKGTTKSLAPRAASRSTATTSSAKAAGKAGTEKTEAKKSASAAPAAKAAKSGKAGKAEGNSNSTGGASKPSHASQLNTLAGAGAKASAGQDSAGASSHHKAATAPARSSKAPSRKAPAAGNKAAAPPINAPLDTVPAAKRGTSPLKKDPTNIAIQAHQSSSGRRTQGKRDSR